VRVAPGLWERRAQRAGGRLLCAALDGVLTAKTWPCSLSQALRAAVSLPSVQGRGRLAVRAARVAGVEIPNQKRLETALTYAPPRRRPAHPPLTPAHLRSYIYGIGPTTAKAILVETVRLEQAA